MYNDTVIYSDTVVRVVFGLVPALVLGQSLLFNWYASREEKKQATMSAAEKLASEQRVDRVSTRGFQLMLAGYVCGLLWFMPAFYAINGLGWSVFLLIPLIGVPLVIWRGMRSTNQKAA
jgi:hypothetical protein